MRAFFTFVAKHNILTTLVALIIVFAGYRYFRHVTSPPVVTRYVAVAVTKGTLVTTVTGSGQVSSSNQVDLKSKASGDIVTLAVSNGQEVRSGALIAQLDARDAQKAVRDAEANLASAQLSLEKLQQPADTLSIIQAENALAQAQESKQNAEANLAKAYDDAFNYISNAFLDLPSIMQGLDGILHDETVGNKGQENINAYADSVKEYDVSVLTYRDDVDARYRAARDAYDATFAQYKNATRDADRVTIESLLSNSYQTARDIAEAVKSANNYINFVQDILIARKLTSASITVTYLDDLDSYTNQVNSHLLNLLNVQNIIKTSKDTITNADRSIIEKTESLKKLKAGAHPLDIESSKLTIQQRKNAFTDAQEKLADYTIRAPFAGTIAAVNIKKSDTVSSGTVITTLIARQKIAEISLNEVDIAKVKIGQKATITFDAIEGLGITGEVVEIDAIGTVSQGIVSYNLKISFDTQDDRVKPGMSISAAIITNIKQEVLLVPNSAVKVQGDTSFVELLDTREGAAASGTQGIAPATPPRAQTVAIGITNDTSTEIISGLQEGEYVVTRTITPSSGSGATTNAPSLFPTGGGTRGATGGGAFRRID